MKNLDQIRAAHALAYCSSPVNLRGKEGGNILKKLPALVMGNGLLASGAFAYAQKDDSGWRPCFDHIAQHLASPDIAIIPRDQGSLDMLLQWLSKNADSEILKRATDETLAWLSFARRFDKSSKGEGHHDSDD